MNHAVRVRFRVLDMLNGKLGLNAIEVAVYLVTVIKPGVAIPPTHMGGVLEGATSVRAGRVRHKHASRLEHAPDFIHERNHLADGNVFEEVIRADLIHDTIRVGQALEYVMHHIRLTLWAVVDIHIAVERPIPTAEI